MIAQITLVMTVDTIHQAEQWFDCVTQAAIIGWGSPGSPPSQVESSIWTEEGERLR